MTSPEFLVADLPAQGLVLARHTAEVTGSQVDSIRERPVALDHRYVSSHLVMLQGFDEQQFRAVLDDMRSQYPDVQVLSTEPAGRRWILRNRVKSDHVAAKQLLFLNHTESEFGLYWTHIRNGKFQLRAQIRDRTSGLQDIERLKAVFRKAGIPAQVRLAHLPDGEVAVARLLEELLVQYPG